MTLEPHPAIKPKTEANLPKLAKRHLGCLRIGDYFTFFLVSQTAADNR
jgi:hypothetical protein